MTVTEKVAYLKGLIEGFAVDENTKEGKMLKAMMDVLSDLAVSVEDLEDSISDLTDQVDAIDEDLDALETDFYDEDCDCCGDDDEEAYYDVCLVARIVKTSFMIFAAPTAMRSSASMRKP